MIKAIVLDLDGTLLKEDKTVSQETINALLKFKSQSNKILFATARPPRDAYKYVPKELRDNPIICYNGACVINSQKQILYRKEMTQKDILEILKEIKKFGYNQLCLEIDDALYSNFDTSEFFGNALTQIVDLEKLEFETAYKAIICSKNPISKDVLEELPHFVKGVVTDNGTICQIMNSEVSKWNTIKSLTEKLGIDTKNIIAFGDDYNDIDMIKNAGIGIAMGNAEEDVKKVANFVTDTNVNDGVAKYIKQKVLEELER